MFFSFVAITVSFAIIGTYAMLVACSVYDVMRGRK